MSTSPTENPGLPPGLGPLTETEPRLIGPYRLLGRIGAGGMGVVYAALDPGGLCVALKTVHAKYADRPGHRESFAREVEMLRRADGVSTARVHGADPTAPVPWLAFDYVPGRDLRRHVREFGPLTGDMLRTFALGMAEGLATLHSAGIAHRDIKPGNVILAPDGPKIVDFGIAVEVGTDPERDASASYGTPGWSAPERYTGAVADPAADVFAWGGLVALAATGRAPFGKGDAAELAARVQAGDHDVEGVPEELLSLVEWALSVLPAERPTAFDLLTALLPPATMESNVQAGPDSDRARTQRALRGMLADYWHGVDSAGHDPARWAAALGTVSAAGLGVAGAGTLGAGAGTGATTGVSAAGKAGGVAAGGGSLGAGTTGGGGLLGVLGGTKGLVAALGTLTLVGGLAAGGAWYLGNDAPAEETAAEEPEEVGLAIENDPEDGVAVVAEALELVRGASDLLYLDQNTADERAREAVSLLEYTEDPVRAVQRTNYHPMRTSVYLRFGDDLEESIGGLLDTSQDGGGNVDYYRSEENATPTGRELRESLDWPLEWILEPDAEIEYLGLSPVPHPSGTLDHFRDGLAFEVAEGHHYSGTYIDRTEVPESLRMDVDFDLWIDDQGYPLRIDTSGLTIPENPEHPETTFDQERDYIFHEPREIHIPDESELDS
ncbi:serine/threonine-protein kinase [Nocardiopsis alba]|uniref:Phosphotransferase enzyme family protein n=1 Tax=Nocardiopsis alba (strain ATCC BAA-2165 / BE74) TaxID=1205910 RepID=J7L4U9_NOCAA|nr:serine/threonine-protein kinase [Nocardiopsis alba]AFR06460.1 phosphotransferase enzyme family protein [Nocardiopsis alba ATCC BAA-2165]